MLSCNNTEDIKEMTKYGKARGFLLARRYQLPSFSNYYIIQSKQDIERLLEQHPNQKRFCMRADTKIGSKPISVSGRNGTRYSIQEFWKEIEEKSKKVNSEGVALIYWLDNEFCNSYETNGSFYLNFCSGEKLIIDYVGKGWDGSVLSHGSVCHETFVIPWEDILLFEWKNKAKYRQKIVNVTEYKEQRNRRINQLVLKGILSLKEAENVIPMQYQGISKDILNKVIEKVIFPMYENSELQQHYKEFIPIVQFEKEKIVVPEIICPDRLKIKSGRI